MFRSLLNLGNTAQWELRFSADLLPLVGIPDTMLHFPQAENSDCVRIPPLPIKGVALYGDPGNGKYTKYSRIFHTFAWAKISRRKSLPHYAVLPLFFNIIPQERENGKGGENFNPKLRNYPLFS